MDKRVAKTRIRSLLSKNKISNKVHDKMSQITRKKFAKTTITTIFSFIFLLFCVLPSAAFSVSSSELIENAKKFSNKEIVFSGEAIGDVMMRGNYGWVNIHDGANAIGVWASSSQLKQINKLGDYKHRGDIVWVKGIFNQSCNQHGGDLDIHALELVILKNGYETAHKINNWKIITSITLSAIALLLFILNRRRQS